MKLLFKAKDGGKDSTVTGYWLIEWKAVFSVVLLKFEGLSRDVHHTHAFHSLSWVLRNELQEKFKNNYRPIKLHQASFKPFITRKDDFHKVNSLGTTWVLSFRGPWHNNWKEYDNKEIYTLTQGRKRINDTTFR